jgi:two-component system, sensor histidine kinase and response regulator
VLDPGTIAERRALFAEEAFAEIARRTKPGVFAPFALVLLLVAAAPEADRHLLLSSIVLAATLGLGAFRLALCRRGGLLRARRPRLWIVLFDAAALGTAAVWSGFALAIVVAHGFDAFSLLAIIAASGLAAGASATLAIRHTLFRAYLATILVPLLTLSVMQHDATGNALSLLFLLFAAFLWSASNQQRETFWRSVADRSLLDAHARELARRIAEKDRAEVALRESEAWTRTIVENALDAVIATDDHGVVEGWNRQAEKIFGWKRDEAMGRSLSDLIVPGSLRGAHEDAMERLRATGTWEHLNTRIERTAVDRDGREFPVELAVAEAYYGSRRILSCFVRDISDRKRWEDEMKRARDAALESVRLKSEFLANVSHEIRTPMNGIIGMTELALDTDLTDDQTEYLEAVQSSAASLLVVINDVLDFSKIEAGHLDFEAIPFRLRDVLGETVKSLALRAHEKGLELVCDVDPDAPDQLVGDPGRLRQVLVNLIGNAIKFTQSGEIVARVRLERPVAETAALRFTIVDSGIGISEEQQRRIFEPFMQADGSTTRRFGGTGLGLSIACRLVETMGGTIRVDSTPGQGSSFWFSVELPRSTANIERAPAPQIALAGLSVVVVDDNATNRRTLKGMLDRWGMKTRSYESGTAALAAIRQAAEAGGPFDLALLDVQMPDMDGFTLAREILENSASAAMPILLLTSSGQRGDGARCREMGIAAYLMKPIMSVELHRALQTVCGAPATRRKDALVTRHSLREGSRLRILLAEDNAVNRLVAVKMLERRGHEVVAVVNGREAAELALPGDFDVVLMDVQMPVMDGFAATALIREREAAGGERLPIIALTAHAMKGDEAWCLEAGMDAYLAKPLDADLLFQTIEALARERAPRAAVPVAG